MFSIWPLSFHVSAKEVTWTYWVSLSESTHLLHELRGVVEKEGVEIGIHDEGCQQVVVHQS